MSAGVKCPLPLTPPDHCWWCNAPTRGVIEVESARGVTVEARVCASCLERLLAPYDEAPA